MPLQIATTTTELQARRTDGGAAINILRHPLLESNQQPTEERSRHANPLENKHFLSSRIFALAKISTPFLTSVIQGLAAHDTPSFVAKESHAWTLIVKVAMSSN
jgi:hypothetical protein